MAAILFFQMALIQTQYPSLGAALPPCATIPYRPDTNLFTEKSTGIGQEDLDIQEYTSTSLLFGQWKK